ncbi:MAG: hypothetical protein KJN89_10330 [Gammaproteobacteria bacterium]|nr:hypothetical protein [Gammaproteobacteria bacterium]MBT8133264.1 hypothetical protein [Gammaproteobacteria bacterium]NNJ50763.1 hypothetical protein [Gammaproteobacteria bacterium]
MNHPAILGVFLLCITVSACNKQEQATSIEKAAVIEAAPVIPKHEKSAVEKTGTAKNRPAINLSIDDLHADHQLQNKNFLNTESQPMENNNIPETSYKNKTKPGINLSGKLFTDEDKLETKDYFNSVDGLQINIEGKFR